MCVHVATLTFIIRDTLIKKLVESILVDQIKFRFYTLMMNRSRRIILTIFELILLKKI